MNYKQAYYEKLKDPRWQKKRLKILERDNWQCQSCCCTDKTLHVHHKAYMPNREPWEYPNWMLVALCEVCHEHEGADGKDSVNDLAAMMKRIFWSDQAIDLVPELALAMEHGIDPHRLSRIITGAIQDELWGNHDNRTNGGSSLQRVSEEGRKGSGEEVHRESAEEGVL